MHVRALIFVCVVFAFALPALRPIRCRARSPNRSGMSSERLARMAQVLRADIEKGRMPGAVIAVARKGRLVYYESFGFLDKAAGTPMPKDAIFSIASMTKPMVAVGIMQLDEAGRCMIDDPVVEIPAAARQACRSG